MLRTFRHIAPALCLLAIPVAAQAQATTPPMHIVRMDPALDAVIAPGTQVAKVAGGFVFTEGPMWKDGKLWFSDVRGDKVRTLTPDGKVTVVLNDSGGIKNAP